ncbi:MAG: hybrid sensor histidine kinase/response regulator [Sulfuricellaceae bacterium]|nr:hybrid sensor histidine kinase/response regulator [Sulfuricellaceae bacterium]
MKIDKSKYIARFVAEAVEHLKHMNDGLLALEKDSGQQEALNLILRSAHTIKGSSRMLGLPLIGELAHKLEDALEVLKTDKRGASFFDTVFKALDVISEMVNEVRDGGENNQDLAGILEALQNAAQGTVAEAEEAQPVESTGSDEVTPQAVKQIDGTASSPGEASDSTAGASLVSQELLPQQKQKPTESPAKITNAETVRVDTYKLDQATKLVAELVSNQSRLRRSLTLIEAIRRESAKNLDQISSLDYADEAYQGAVQLTQKINVMLRQLDLDYKNDLVYQNILTEELLENVSRMRMLPISTILGAYHRYVRDISVSCGKKVELVTEGDETELDKTIIDKIGDPLLHMIRNSIDHGIESPDERTRARKPSTGVIKIKSGYDAGSVCIDISDDGGGISVQKLKEKAVQKKLYDMNALDEMTENQILNLIFMPGFSTSTFITDISGRGVGMDVVKNTIVEQLKGSVHIQTVEGQGTTFHIKLPLTLAIMRVFQVKVGGALIGITVSSITEVMKIKYSEIIDVVDKKAIRLREKLIPVVHLNSIVDIPGAPAEQYAMVMVLSYADELLGVIVDSLISEEDMEIKVLPKHMKNNGLVSGVALTGKNDIVIVLNISKVFAHAKNVRTSKTIHADASVKSVHILVVDDSVNTREIERSILESFGYHVDVATDGLDGYEKAQSFQYDLIVSDVEMPRMDGFSLTEKLRKDDAYKHTPIVIVSSRDKEEDKRRGMQAGANAYIVKGSFEQSNLLSTVQTLVEVLPD